MLQYLIRIVLLTLLLVVASTVSFALATSIDVPVSGVGQQQRVVSTQDLAPSQCAGMNLQAVVTGSGEIVGSSANELILGSSGADVIHAVGGNNCIVGGSGNDTIFGGEGNDIIVPGSGDNTVDGGDGVNICYGGSWPGNTFENCDEIYP